MCFYDIDNNNVNNFNTLLTNVSHPSKLHHINAQVSMIKFNAIINFCVNII